jgi:hypothetical protein
MDETPPFFGEVTGVRRIAEAATYGGLAERRSASMNIELRRSETIFTDAL